MASTAWLSITRGRRNSSTRVRSVLSCLHVLWPLVSTSMTTCTWAPYTENIFKKFALFHFSSFQRKRHFSFFISKKREKKFKRGICHEKEIFHFSFRRKKREKKNSRGIFLGAWRQRKRWSWAKARRTSSSSVPVFASSRKRTSARSPEAVSSSSCDGSRLQIRTKSTRKKKKVA